MMEHVFHHATAFSFWLILPTILLANNHRTIGHIVLMTITDQNNGAFSNPSWADL